MSASGKARVTSPAPQRRLHSSERHRRGEMDRVDCVRIVHKHRNLLAHAPDRLHDEVSADYTDMIYAATPADITERRRAFLRTWRLKCRAVADSLEGAGDKLFTFTRLPPSQWKSARTPDALDKPFSSRRGGGVMARGRSPRYGSSARATTWPRAEKRMQSPP